MNLIILILKIVIIITLPTIKTTFCTVPIAENILQIKNNHCPMNIKYWNLFKWYFNFIRTPFLVITKITDYPLAADSLENNNDDLNLFAEEMFDSNYFYIHIYQN